ncbi:hypothetical protein FVE85_0036 [Porphyridium purpureum]|uniref:Uncharacterized protein n=1 Tax=Porphyridium purpureum TaxID=35688 RepID=A0A5J4Z0V5_PORPP|nr:hypothetical protein FVE85_0036 [Porphyridium purpureum]|eukprot:POR0390..scf208_2
MNAAAFVQPQLQLRATRTGQRAAVRMCETTPGAEGPARSASETDATLDLGSTPRRAFLSAAVGAVAACAAGAGIDAASAAPIFKWPSSRPGYLGPQGGGRYLNLCPLSKNCVSTSNSIDSQMYIPPWNYSGKTLSQAVAEVTEVINEQPGATIIVSKPVKSDRGDGWYISAEFESPTFGFVDDFEALFAPDNKTVDYRSQARTGADDQNVNRKRIKNMRLALEKKAGWKSAGFAT